MNNSIWGRPPGRGVLFYGDGMEGFNIGWGGQWGGMGNGKEMWKRSDNIGKFSTGILLFKSWVKTQLRDKGECQS